MPTSVENLERAERIYKRLKASASQGLPCPKNSDLAASFGCAISTISKGIKLLEDKGLIKIKGGNNWRVVTICEGDLKTGQPEARIYSASDYRGKINGRDLAPVVRREPPPAKTAEQLHIDAMAKASRELYRAVTTTQLGCAPRTSSKLVWRYAVPEAVTFLNPPEQKKLNYSDSRTCRRCGARSGKCSHGERWLR